MSTEYLPGQIDIIDYIEGVEERAPKVVDTDQSISDDALERGGLVPVKAFVRSKASKNAERVRKSAKRRETGEAGPPRKQLNLQAPVEPESRDALKRLNAALLDGEITAHDLDMLTSKQDDIDWRARALAAEAELAELKAIRQRPRPWWRFWSR